MSEVVVPLGLQAREGASKARNLDYLIPILQDEFSVSFQTETLSTCHIKGKYFR